MTARCEPSPIVIISWWSNCLALASLRAMDAHAIRRCVYVVQVGKSAEQRERFRRHLPPSVIELPYAAAAPAEHSRVIEQVALRERRAWNGVWFLDHDVFVREPLDPWLAQMDAWFEARRLCLGLSPHLSGPAVTSPAFWLSPTRWPATAPSLDPVPFEMHASASRPDLCVASAPLRMPQKDTLVSAWEHLQAERRADHWPSDFPAHTHLGGLSLFTSPSPPFVDAWTRATAARFREFFATCPPEWVRIEEPTLLRRCHEFADALA